MTKKLFHIKGIINDRDIVVFECVEQDITLAIKAVRDFQKLEGGIFITDVALIEQAHANSELYVRPIGGYRF